MTAILSITLPIFLLIAVGFAAVRAGALSSEFIQGLGAFVLNFALPALVLHALLSQDFRAVFDLRYLAVYALGSLLAFAAIYALFRLMARRPRPEAAIAALGASASNSGFVGFPIASLALGPVALIALPLCMLVEVVLVIPLALGLAEAGKDDGHGIAAIVRTALLRLVRMPLVIAIAVGLILTLVGVTLPLPLATAVDMVANASAACALFVVGGTLAGVAREAFSPEIAWIAMTKLVLHPLLVGLGFWVIGGVEPALVTAGIVFAAAPMITAYPIFGQRFGLGGPAAAGLVVATALSFVTITALLAWLAVPAAEAWLTQPSGDSQMARTWEMAHG